MQKLKVTRKDIKASYNNIYNVGYCNMYYLLTGIEPRYYNCGVYGWNWDAYEIEEGICIITGYRNTLGVNVDSKQLRYYEEQAREIRENWGIKYDEQLRLIKELRKEFIEKVLNK